MKRAVLATLVLFVIAFSAAASPAAADPLSAGAGRADITPPTGYPLLGWARGDQRGEGQHTRLFARALVLRAGDKKLALVALDLNMVPGGLVQQAARAAGFGEDEVIVAATHTHAGPTGFSNFLFKDSAVATVEAPNSAMSQPDPLLYSFMVRQTTQAIERAKRDRGPASAAWGSGTLRDVTRNRSLEAHLANHGVHEPRGSGRTDQDPDGAGHPVDPTVDVLRVDKVVRGKRVPIGGWSNFPNHGTVDKGTFHFYNGDHHAAADRVFEAAVRRSARVPDGQEVVNVFPNGAAGDASAGLDETGPAGAESVGRREAAAMLRAWRTAGKSLERDIEIDTRWTRVCFCGQTTPLGPLDDHAVLGRPYLTGSEEGRGPLFDLTGQILEGTKLAEPTAGAQGVKDAARSDDAKELTPTAVPLSAVRVGDRLLVTVPGEMTAELGRRLRGAVADALRPGREIERVVIAGYANEYASYLTTPEEYDEQHYEGGTTVFGRVSGPFVVDGLADLAARLRRGEPAPAPHPFDPTRGLRPTAGRYPTGARRARILTQPRGVARLTRARLRWRGGPAGLDRPLDDAFVRIERRVGRSWQPVTDDLGLQIAWRVEEKQLDGPPKFPRTGSGTYSAQWEVPLDAPRGSYRFRVTGNRYALTSRAFAVRPSRALVARLARTDDGGYVVQASYPVARENVDLTARPADVCSGTVEVSAAVDPDSLAGAAITTSLTSCRAEFDASFGQIAVPANAVRDRWGNTNAEAVAGEVQSGAR